MPIATTDPATGIVIREYSPHNNDEVDIKIDEARRAFVALKHTDFPKRAAWMHRAADMLEAESEHVATTIVKEMGKPITQARGEVAKCVTGMRFYAEHSQEFLSGHELPRPSVVGASSASVRYQPLGTVLAVMPWNYPLWQVIRFAAPALMAGNTGLLKHASNVPQSALYLDSLFERAGFPAGCFRTLLIPASRVEAVARDSRVAAVTLTGSEPAGRSIGAIAGAELKPSVLELGGSDPFIVMSSADISRAVATAVTSRTSNNGQACINAKRFIVHADVYDSFVDKFVVAMESLKVGPPMDEETDVGPIATSTGRDELHQLVGDARKHGAKVATGGEKLEGGGWYYPPTVITGVTKGMRLYAEEAFGPVATVFRVADRQEALELANDTTFGLSSAVWTQDSAEEAFFVDGIEAGAVFVNGMSVSYPELPFGGVKDSGIGRELSAEGIREFCNLKTVWRG
ncbi:NADP-dependent succinic semialdehyde dehydrogenase [Brevibacterium sp. UCMA 11754]|uniref:NADP-dependent succinic semialdehyde dehydrogenase n=1 Tax=Brevibacterium sp. UCMA 11754 TaxID=2749198 RepID=UPI001F404F84|nr:NADP-dependent succinic semialdehyde dehydrogenase [Brevibacterium sp. UCMA 11754]MCF2571138.1 NADP-dependent succinic semialdehyde dehydrogenase [Brevibacterium sp. UCMA 11754]